MQTKSIKLAPFCTTRNLEPLFVELMGTKPHPVEIDATDVDAVSSACLQILLCAEQDWKARNCSFGMVNINQPCRENLIMLGADPSWLTNEVTQ